METVARAAEMAVIAMLSVGLWTLRVALTSRGRRVAGAVAAGMEALVFLLAFSTILRDLDALEKVIGYALGVAAGTLLGLYVDDRLSAGQSEVRIVTTGHDRRLVNELRALGWPLTWVEGEGPEGPVTVAFVALDDARLSSLLKELEARGPDTFWTVERLKKARAAKQHQGWLQVGAARPLSWSRVRA